MELFVLLFVLNQTLLLSGDVSEDFLFDEGLFLGGEELLLFDNFSDVSFEENIFVITDDLTFTSSSCPSFFVNSSVNNFTLSYGNRSTLLSEVSCDDCLEELFTGCSLVNEPTTCPLALGVEVGRSYALGETIRFTPILTSTEKDFSLRYWWSDYFNNTLRSSFTTKNLNTKQYTPNYALEEPFDIITLHLVAENACNSTSFSEHIILHNPLFEEEASEEVVVEELTLCNTTLAIDAPERLFAGETIRFTPQTNIAQDYFVLRYWFENTLGDIIKDPLETTNLNTKQYTPVTALTKEQQDLVLVLRMSLENECVLVQANKTVVVTNKEYVNEDIGEKTGLQKASSQSSLQEKDNKPALRLDVPQNPYESFNATITIYNDAFSAQEYFVIAYPYRYSTNFSSRTPELVIVPASSEEIINYSFVLAPGEYSFKAQLWPPNRKTPIEERTTIQVQETTLLEEEVVEEAFEQGANQETLTALTQEPVVVLPERIRQPITGYTVLDKVGEYKDQGLFFALLAGITLWILAYFMRRRNGEHEEKIL